MYTCRILIGFFAVSIKPCRTLHSATLLPTCSPAVLEDGSAVVRSAMRSRHRNDDQQRRTNEQPICSLPNHQVSTKKNESSHGKAHGGSTSTRSSHMAVNSNTYQERQKNTYRTGFCRNAVSSSSTSSTCVFCCDCAQRQEPRGSAGNASIHFVSIGVT